MSEKVFTNEGNNYYCIAEVEAGKAYKVIGNPDKRIYFRYAITHDDHETIKFMGAPVDLDTKFTHILRPTVSGHLCIKSMKHQPDYWSTMTVTVEEVEV